MLSRGEAAGGAAQGEAGRAVTCWARRLSHSILLLKVVLRSGGAGTWGGAGELRQWDQGLFLVGSCAPTPRRRAGLKQGTWTQGPNPPVTDLNPALLWLESVW